MTHEHAVCSPEYRAHLQQRLDECQVPESLHDGLIEYIGARRPVGGFLAAILSNNLVDAVTRADDINRPQIATVVFFLLNYATATCWGSPAAVKAWLEDPEPPREVFE